MAENHQPRPQRLLGGIGGRTISVALRPVSGAATAAAHASIELQRRAVERVLDSPEFQRLVSEAVNSERVHTAFLRLFESQAAVRLVDGFFDSGLFDRLAERLLASDGLWELVDRIADSPAVTAAITQQSLGFADQVGVEVRDRSRRADDWLERAAHRLSRRRATASTPELPAAAEDATPATP